MNENLKNLSILLVLITVLLTTALLFSIRKLSSKTDSQSGASAAQTQPKIQKIEKQTNIPPKKFTIPFDEEMAAKIKKVFEPILSETESEEMGRSYAAIGYNVAIMLDLYDELHSRHLSDEEQDKYRKLISAHQQALEILRQNRALKEQQSPEAAASVTMVEKEFYLPGPEAVKGLKGQQQSSRKEIECPSRYTGYKNWNKICQEIQFTDGTNSIIYIVAKRGITAREDFDAEGHLLVRHQFWSAGGFFDPDKIRHIPDYPTTVSDSIYYDRNGAVIQTEAQPSETIEAGKASLSPQEEALRKKQVLDSIVQWHKKAPKYCDLYKSECDVL